MRRDLVGELAWPARDIPQVGRPRPDSRWALRLSLAADDLALPLAVALEVVEVGKDVLRAALDLDGLANRRHRRDATAAALASSAAGFSSDERAPASAPSAVARTARRMIFAERVFGSASTKKMRSGLNARPSSCATASATSSSVVSAPGRR